jgi:hypothetical protein
MTFSFQKCVGRIGDLGQQRRWLPRDLHGGELLITGSLLPAEHLCDKENHDRTENTASTQQVDERITGRRKQRWAKYERFHFLTPSKKSGHSLFLGCQRPVNASAVFSYHASKERFGTGLPDRFLHGFLYRVGCLLDGLLGLPDGLIGLSFLAKFVIAGQRPGGFLDSTFYFVSLATHDSDSFS